MHYAVVHVQKFKASAVTGIQIHNHREKDHSHSNPDIDHTLSSLNYDLHPRTATYHQAIKSRIERLNLKRAVRKDAVVMCGALISSDTEYFQDKTPEEQRKLFETAYHFLKTKYGEENVVSCTVHMDETTPHMHFEFVPITSDGRLSAKDLVSKNQLRALHTQFHQEVGKNFDLARGENETAGKRRKHFDTAEYKAYMQAIEDARYELFVAETDVDFFQEQAKEARQKAEKWGEEAKLAEVHAEEQHRRAVEATTRAATALTRVSSFRDEENAVEGRLRALQGQLAATEDACEKMTQALSIMTEEVEELKSQKETINTFITEYRDKVPVMNAMYTAFQEARGTQESFENAEKQIKTLPKAEDSKLMKGHIHSTDKNNPITAKRYNRMIATRKQLLARVGELELLCGNKDQIIADLQPKKPDLKHTLEETKKILERRREEQQRQPQQPKNKNRDDDFER